MLDKYDSKVQTQVSFIVLIYACFFGYTFVGTNRFYLTLHYVKNNVNDIVAAISVAYSICKNIAVRNIFVRESMLHYANIMKYGMIGPAS